MAAGHAPCLWHLVPRDIPECVAFTVGEERNPSKCEEVCEITREQKQLTSSMQAQCKAVAQRANNSHV